MNYIKLFVFLFFLVGMIGCTNKKNNKQLLGNCDSLDINLEEIHFPPSSVLQLKSYYLNSSYRSDSTNYLVGYNYRAHALDCMNLEDKTIIQIPLLKEGPEAIMRLSGIFAQNSDSIWLYDESGTVLLMNKNGEIINKIKLQNYLKVSEQVWINTNYAISISHLYYNNIRKSLFFTVRDDSTSPAEYKVKEISVLADSLTSEYKLLPSVVEPNIDNGYANMNRPNVNFYNNMIYYNYPIESHIYTLDINTGERKTIAADSKYTLNKAEKCKSTKDYSLWERHSVENPHFYDVVYIPAYKVFARLHLAEREFDATKSIDYLMNDRGFYLMLFDENFEVIYENKLKEKRYNYFTGWSALSNGMALFVDNSLDTQNDTDDLLIDIIHPLMKPEEVK